MTDPLLAAGWATAEAACGALDRWVLRDPVTLAETFSESRGEAVALQIIAAVPPAHFWC